MPVARRLRRRRSCEPPTTSRRAVLGAHLESAGATQIHDHYRGQRGSRLIVCTAKTSKTPSTPISWDSPATPGARDTPVRRYSVRTLSAHRALPHSRPDTARSPTSTPRDEPHQVRHTTCERSAELAEIAARRTGGDQTKLLQAHYARAPVPRSTNRPTRTSRPMSSAGSPQGEDIGTRKAWAGT